MTQDLKKKWWQIVLLVLAAIAGVAATRATMPLDEIKNNTRINIEQSRDIQHLEQNYEKLYDAIKDLSSTIENKFQSINDKIDRFYLK